MLYPFMITAKHVKPDGLDELIARSGLTETMLKIFQTGWGNGYVAVSKGHPWYGVSMHELDVRTESSITFSEYVHLVHPLKLRSTPKKFWLIGFDTMHYGNNLETWPESRVVENTLVILLQAASLHYEIQKHTKDHRKLK